MGKLLNRLTALKSTAKSLQRQARKCKKEEKSEKRKNKKALEKGNVDGARIYAENAFRKQTERLNYLRLSSRLHAIVAYLGILDEMATLKESLRNIFRSLKSTLATENIQNMPETTDMFEKQVAEFLELVASTFFSPSTGDVNSLMQQVADDYGHEISVGLPQPAAHAVLALETEKVDEDDLAKRRLALLKASDEIVYATAGKEN